MPASRNVLTDINRVEMERAARARGYDSYDHMIYSMKRRLPPPRIPGGGNTVPAQGGMMNFLQSLFANPGKALHDAFAWHPANTIGTASSVLERATNGG